MKIAQFTDTFTPQVNGVSFSVETFSRLLSKSGQVEVYAPAYKTGEGCEKSGELMVRRYRSMPLPMYKDVRLVISDPTKIYKEVIQFRPDVVHVHDPGSMGLVGIMLARRMKKPLVGTYHTLFSETLMYISPSHMLRKYLRLVERVTVNLGLEEVKATITTLLHREHKDVESIPSKLTWSLVNSVYSLCDVVICPSESICRELKKRGFKGRTIVVSNGVDLKLFWTKTNYKDTGRVIYVGRLGWEKNVDVVIKAFGLVCEKDTKAKLIIVGGGPAKKDLEKLVEELGLGKRVQFLGMVKRQSLPKLYRESDVMVTASTMETQGMVVLEAMASGLPVIGVKKFALPDLIKENKTGHLANPGDVANIAKWMGKLLSDKEERKKLGMGARKLAIEHDVNKMAKKLEGIYRQLASLDTI